MHPEQEAGGPTRPMTDSERQQVEIVTHVDDPSSLRALVGIMGAIGALLLAVLVAALSAVLPGERSVTGATLLGALLGMAVGVALGLAIRVGNRRLASAARRDLAVGLVRTQVVTVHAALRARGLESEGPAFFLDLGGGELLFLSDGALAETMAAGRFPSGCLSLAYSPTLQRLLSVEPAGEPLLSIQGDVSPSGEAELLQHGARFRGTLEEIVAGKKPWMKHYPSRTDVRFG